MDITTNYYNIAPLAEKFHEVLANAAGEKAAVAIEGLVLAVGLILVYAILAVVLIYMERRVCAAFQCRIGPNRVGGRGGLCAGGGLLGHHLLQMPAVGPDSGYHFLSGYPQSDDRVEDQCPGRSHRSTVHQRPV